jgi:hemin uptake protein HemP
MPYTSPLLPTASDTPSATPILNSSDILRGQKVVPINHNGTIYRLQITQAGKLILTK